MTEPTIRTEIDARNVATITFDRAEAHNAQNGAMLIALAGTLKDLEANPDIRLLVLRANGKSFCAGADLRDQGTEPAPSLPSVIHLFMAFTRPTLALVQGACIGGGLAWAAAADIVVASEDAFFSIPEVRLGFNPASLIPMFNNALGPRNARRYILGGDRFDGAKAYDMGLVHHLSANGELAETAAPIIDSLLAGGPKATVAAKKTIAELAGQSVSTELSDRLDAIGEESRKSDEADEGRASFREKRSPSWKP